ncbi:SurA N-terminal domain-containing protein [Selenihalanaerobacter shriftii]|uniref:Tetratricopeptide repeat-containing protein n=1 Tax=Selenihalanaerobacter shriftii TaxID=142842 RepID=A0A1T4N022_9FIRM|nr:SurA N-terminal domain-containing protein [Selenihalanaerobacter shriftii]SJZ72582.1 Tetratricopeptide repeat-containing protein [Selenihalanaerobacter shriftii]
MLFDSLRNNSRILVYIVVVAFVAGGVLVGVSGLFNKSSSASQKRQTAQVQPGKQSIAIVNGKQISYTDYMQILQTMKRQYGGQISGNQILALKNKVLDQLINQELLLQKAKEDNLKVEVTDKEVQKQLDTLINNYAKSKKEFEKILVDRGLTLSGVKADLKTRLREQKLLQKIVNKLQSGVKVTNKEVKEAYKKAKGQEKLGKEFEKNKAKLKANLQKQKANQALGKALNKYKKEVNIKVNSVELRAFRAAQKDNLDKAASEYKQALELSPNATYLYINLAQVYQKQNNNETALKTYKKALNKDPKNLELRFALGKYYYQTSKKEKAVNEFNKASELAGDNLIAHYRLQGFYKKMGYEEKAKEEMKKVREIQKKLAEKQKKAKAQQKEMNKNIKLDE